MDWGYGAAGGQLLEKRFASSVTMKTGSTEWEGSDKAARGDAELQFVRLQLCTVYM